MSEPPFVVFAPGDSVIIDVSFEPDPLIVDLGIVQLGGGSTTSGSGSGALTADYTIFSDGGNAYRAVTKTGSVLSSSTDSGSVSGLLTVLNACKTAGLNNKHLHFATGRFHFLNSVSGQDHVTIGSGSTAAPIVGLTISGEGIGATIISNYSTLAADTEPLSFTNVLRCTLKDFTIEASGPYRGSSDALDFDHCQSVVIDRVEVRRSRSRGIVFDGGDPGKTSYNNIIRNCIIRGRPTAPQCVPATTGGTLAAGTYRYMLTFVDPDLGETRPGPISETTTTGTTSSVTVKIPVGPYGVSSRKVYRKTGTGGATSWDLVATVADNTTTVVTDTGAAGTPTTIASTGVRNGHLIPQSGLEFLGCDSNIAENNLIDGVGSEFSETSGAGIGMVAKSTTKPSTKCIARGNTIRYTYGPGVKLGGSDTCQITGNNIIGSGWNSAGDGGQHPGIRLITDSTIVPFQNVITGNYIGDNRNTNMLGASGATHTRMQGAVYITNGTETVVMGNVFHAGYNASTLTWWVDAGSSNYFGASASGVTTGRQGDNHHYAEMA